MDILASLALGFSVSLAFFNHGRIYQSVPLAYPPLLYLLARMLADRHHRHLFCCGAFFRAAESDRRGSGFCP